MDPQLERQLKSQARKWLPKIFKWLKKKFFTKPQGQSNYQQSYGSQQPQGYGQQPQGYGQQPQQGTYAAPHASFEPYGQSSYAQQGSTGSNVLQPVTNQQPVSHQWSAADADADVTTLRNQAIDEGNAMKRCFDQAHDAHARGDGKRAKELSNEGHQHQANKDALNKKAAALIFQEKNAHSPSGTIDLHGLYVQEAIDQAEAAVQKAQADNLPTLRIIVGKGIHSTSHVAKIKPAIEKLMSQYQLSAHLDPHNAGVLIVDLSGQGDRSMGFVHDIARQQPGGEDQCIIS